MKLLIKNIIGYILTVCLGIFCIVFVKELEKRIFADKPSEYTYTGITAFDEESGYRRYIAYQNIK